MKTTACLLTGLLLAATTLPLRAQTVIHGLTITNSLVTFSETPGPVSGAITLTGLGVGETAVGIDFRPFDGKLYVVTRDGANAGWLYTADPVSGAATAVALTGAPLTITGSVGMDFNPAATGGTNALRIVTSDEQNFRIAFSSTPPTVFADTALNVDGGATGTNVIATAYSNNRSGLPGGGGAGGTAQYALDSDTDRLYRVNPPNGGVLTNGLPLGLNIGAAGGLDIITGSDRALAVVTVGGSNAVAEVNLATGAATPLRGVPLEIIDLAIATAPKLTNIVKAASDATLHWSGGIGPFAVHKANIVNEPFCGMFTTVSRSATVSTDGGQGFLRIADLASVPAIRMSVSLSGAAERPTPVTTTGNGFGTLEVNGDTLSFDIMYRALSTPANAMHLHGAAPSSGFAGILIDLAPYHIGPFSTNGNIIGSVKLTAAQKATVLGGLSYVNIHSTMHGGGEIRGQVAPIVFKTALSGAAERATPVDTPAFGFGTFSLVGRELAFNITYTGLKGTVSGAHIHGSAPPSGTAGVLIDLGSFNVSGPLGRPGSIVGSVTLTPDQLGLIADGRTYVNIHSSVHGGGEIRGHVFPVITGTALSAELTGAAERPTPVTTPGSGFAALTLNDDRLHVAIRYRNLSSAVIGAHLHGPAPASASAGVLIDLLPLHTGPLGTSGVFYGSVPITGPQKLALLNAFTYVNIHTVSNGGGEIRGQVAPIVLQSTLTGGAERPTPVVTPGTGFGRVALLGKKFTMGVRYHLLTGVPSDSHLHGPATTSGFAGVLFGLTPYNAGGYGTNGFLLGGPILTDAQLAAVVDSLTYINIHTGANPGGEIRGQVTP